MYLPLLIGAVCGCSGGSSVGEGTRPVELFLGVGQRQSSLNMDECTNVQIGSYLRFEGEAPSVDNYSGRATFVSSDPSTVFVGDGTSVSPDGIVYSPGSLIALKPGLATISSTYLEFNATLVVQVTALGDLRLGPVLTDIAEDLPQKFTMVARFSEARPDQEIDEGAEWRFEPATARAAVSENGTVQANTSRDDTPLTLIARLPECGRAATTTFRVSPITALDLDYEFAGDVRLPLGTSEVVRVFARFAGDGSTRQNVSGSVEIENPSDDFIGATVVLRDAIPTSVEDILNPQQVNEDVLLVTALDREGTGVLDLHVDSGPGLSIRTQGWQTIETELESVEVTPEDISVTYPGEGFIDAIGVFGNGMRRSIARHVNWTSLDPTAAAVSTAVDSPGRVLIANVDRDVEIEAYAESAAVTSSDRATIHIYSAGSASP